MPRLAVEIGRCDGAGLLCVRSDVEEVVNARLTQA